MDLVQCKALTVCLLFIITAITTGNNKKLDNKIMGINFLIVEAVTMNWQLSQRTWVQFLAVTGHRPTYRQNTHTQKREKLKLVGGEGRTCFF